MPPKLTLVFLLAIHQLLGQIDLGRILPVAQPLHVTVIGDFGSGTQHQADVAQALQRRNAQLPFQLGLTVGDNFYRCGVRSIYDRKWITRWENFYTRLGFPFYATLGNHDYGRPLDCVTRSGSPDAQVAYTAKSKSWRMPARYYTFAAGAARFFALDTESWPGAQLRWLKEALEASQHEPGIRWRVGNKEIAEMLLAAGAAPTLFSAAMLGQLETVKAMIAARPGVQKTLGPHGIPLLAHARAGVAKEVIAYLEALREAGGSPNKMLSQQDKEKLVGIYEFGPGANDRLEITLPKNQLTFNRVGIGTARPIHYLGEGDFYPAGARAVRIRVDGKTLTVHDGELVITAKALAR